MQTWDLNPHPRVLTSSILKHFKYVYTEILSGATWLAVAVFPLHPCQVSGCLPCRCDIQTVLAHECLIREQNTMVSNISDDSQVEH